MSFAPKESSYKRIPSRRTIADSKGTSQEPNQTNKRIGDLIRFTKGFLSTIDEGELEKAREETYDHFPKLRDIRAEHVDDYVMQAQLIAMNSYLFYKLATIQGEPDFAKAFQKNYKKFTNVLGAYQRGFSDTQVHEQTLKPFKELLVLIKLYKEAVPT